jgi:N-acetylglutamate synthase and related acetyltransferases
MVKIREATIIDKEKIVELLNSIEQNSYILRFLDEWLRSDNGKVLVAEDDGKIVAISHFFIQNKEVAWFEAARVHKDYRNRGIATMIANTLLNIVKDMGIKKARLVTSASNIPAQRHLAKTIFKVYAKWVSWKFNLQDLNNEDLIFEKSRIEEIWVYLNNSRCFIDSGRLYFDSWVWYDFTYEWLNTKLNENKVFFDGNGIIIFDEMSRFKGNYQTCYFEAKSFNIRKFLKFICLQAKKLKINYDKIFIVTPSNEELISALKNNGLEQISELLIYEAKIN